MFGCINYSSHEISNLSCANCYHPKFQTIGELGVHKKICDSSFVENCEKRCSENSKKFKNDNSEILSDDSLENSSSENKFSSKMSKKEKFVIFSSDSSRDNSDSESSHDSNASKNYTNRNSKK